jgi:hypothetical protein
MIYVAGCHHDIQSEDPVPFFYNGAAVSRQREQFVRLMERLLIDKKVELVAEEWGRKSESFGQVLSKKYMVKYADINTSFDDLDALQIPRDYLDSPCYAEGQKREWLQRRETVMLERIRSARGTAKTVLVICGFDHLESLAGQPGDDESVIAVGHRKDGWQRTDTPPR